MSPPPTNILFSVSGACRYSVSLAPQNSDAGPREKLPRCFFNDPAFSPRLHGFSCNGVHRILFSLGDRPLLQTPLFSPPFFLRQGLFVYQFYGLPGLHGVIASPRVPWSLA